MSAGLDLLFDGAEKLVSLIADEVSKKTGADRALTYEAAVAATKKWVAVERKAVTDARAAAKRKAAAKR